MASQSVSPIGSYSYSNWIPLANSGKSLPPGKDEGMKVSKWSVLRYLSRLHNTDWPASLCGSASAKPQMNVKYLPLRFLFYFREMVSVPPVEKPANRKYHVETFAILVFTLKQVGECSRNVARINDTSPFTVPHYVHLSGFATVPELCQVMYLCYTYAAPGCEPWPSAIPPTNRTGVIVFRRD